MAEPPPGFAGSMESLVAGRAEAASLEAWLTRIAIWITAIATVGFLVSFIGRLVGYLGEVMGDAPWPLLAATLAILGMIKLMEFVPRWGHGTRAEPHGGGDLS
ncbi:hypothetical protein DZC52_12730 [Wenzhouxiangella sediminis]|uniref:Uncharacterized protein n=2 Tax=Wenzhouxiangella sediminis TaxID=1792836 RepID=A0A3E1K659_9GAMM|nr:hypothetical protein DZC52_12730 [Wenzhouxiangella sediminis]